MKKLFVFFVMFLGMISYGYSLNTYVGVKILNLTDDTTQSCIGKPGYGDAGKIRALSSIYPNYPIHMEIRNFTDSSILFSGNVSDGDYMIGDSFYFPTQLDLTIGGTYELFFDIDAIKIFVNSPFSFSYYKSPTFTPNPSLEYWTIGSFQYVSNNNYGAAVNLDSDCYVTSGSGTGTSLALLAHKFRDNVSNIPKNVLNSDAVRFDSELFKIYRNLFQPDSGTYSFMFTLS